MAATNGGEIFTRPQALPAATFDGFQAAAVDRHAAKVRYKNNHCAVHHCVDSGRGNYNRDETSRREQFDTNTDQDDIWLLKDIRAEESVLVRQL